MGIWLEDVTVALENLGGIAHYDAIYKELQALRAGRLPNSWKKIVQRTVQDHSEQSSGFKGHQVFYSVKGIGAGVWGLHSKLAYTPPAFDIEPPRAPERMLVQTYRVLRDTDLARKIKLLHRNSCQVCGHKVRLANGESYSEAHHIRPLGDPHAGPDVAGNILVLCPNHHVMFDYGAMKLETESLRVVEGHVIDDEYVAYHNQSIWPHVKAGEQKLTISTTIRSPSKTVPPPPESSPPPPSRN